MDYEIACTGGTPASKRRHGRGRVLESPGADSQSSALVKAVEFNDVRAVRELLRSGVDLGMLDAAGNTVLHTAARRGHADVCAALILQGGADVNALNKALFSPLFFAARVDLRTVSVLLDLGAEVRLRNHLGEIPLHAAASSGLNDVIVELLSRGSDVNSLSVRGVTPLYCAVGSGSRKAVKTLLSLGAEVNGGATRELSNTNTSGVVIPCQQLQARKSEATSANRSEHDRHVRVCVSRQTQQHPDRLGPAEQQLFLRTVVSERLEGGGIRHRPGPDEAGRPDGRQRGCSAPGRQQQGQRSERDVCARHPLHQLSRGCPATLHLKLHQLDQRECTMCPCPPRYFVVHASSHKHKNQVEESCFERSKIPQSFSQMPPSSCDKMTHPESLVCSSSLGHTAASNRFRLQFSTRPLQMSTRRTEMPNFMKKMVSCNSAADEHTRSSDREKFSASFRQSQQTDADKVASPTDTKLLHPHQTETAEKSASLSVSLSPTDIQFHPNQKEAAAKSTNPPHCPTDLKLHPPQTETAAKSTGPPHCMTPLHRACQLGMETVAQVLLEAGASIMARTERGETPLHVAALYSSTTGLGEVTGLIRLLLQAGADVEAVTTPAGSTPLHLAAGVGDALITSLLITARADLHKLDNQGNTPLHKACERIVAPEANRLRTVRLLLMNGASATAVNHQGLTPLHVLLLHKTDDMDHDVLRVLLNPHADPNRALPSGETPLLFALRHRMYDFAKVLVEKGADPNIREDDGKTPLHYVCEEGRVQLFKLLWSKGGNPATPDNEGFTPLRYALKSGEELVGACINSGASSRQPSPAALAASSITDLFSHPESCSSPFQYAFATAQLTLLSRLYHSGCFSSSELHELRQLCGVVIPTSLQGLTRGQQEVISFVLTVSQCPASLQNLSRWTVSRLIGCGAERKRCARELGLPPLLRDFVLFVKGV